VKAKEFDSVDVFQCAKGFCEDVRRLRGRGDMSNVDVSGIVDMTNIVMTCINVFGTRVIYIVFDMF